MEVDLTGNWRDTEVFHPVIQVHEPALREGQAKAFYQDLHGVGRGATIELEYRPSLDVAPRRAIDGCDDTRDGLSVNDRRVALRWIGEADDADRLVASCPLDGVAEAASLFLRFSWRCTRPPRTVIRYPGGDTDTQASLFYAVGSDPGAGAALVLAHGVPFAVARLSYARASFSPEPRWLDSGSFAPWDGTALDAGGLRPTPSMSWGWSTPSTRATARGTPPRAITASPISSAIKPVRSSCTGAMEGGR